MSAGSKVLIVDDLPENLTVLSRILKGAGHKVLATLSGELALNAAVIDPPDIVLLDIMMPVMDGYEVCRQMKANPQTAEVPILFISALSDPTEKVKAFEVGGMDFIIKPFDEREVLARVTTHVALSQARKQLAAQNVALENSVAELKRLQSQLVNSAKMASLGVLTAGIAHELNNPINFVYANARSCLKLLPQIETVYDAYDSMTPENAGEIMEKISALKDEIGYQECRSGLRKLLEGISVGADRTASIVRGLRMFSRNEASSATTFDLHENIDTALLMLSNKIGKNIRIEKDFRAVAMMVGHPGSLNQVFINLINNAVDAIQGKPASGGDEKIILRTFDCDREGHPYINIEVIDTGMGIQEAVIPHLFEPFFTTKAVGSGIGLGLSIAYGIVRDHGGKLEAENAPGQGSVFRVLLPRKV